MGKDERNLVLESLAKVLRPIIRILVRNRIDCLSVIELIKKLFVEVASNEYTSNARKASLSQVAALTNLNRKLVSRIRKDESDGVDSIKHRELAAERLLDAWHRYPEFSSEAGPIPLVMRGKTICFEKLVQCTGLDVSAGSLRNEMIRLGVVKIGPMGDLIATQHTVDGRDSVNDIVRGFTDGLVPAVTCVVNNILNQGDGQWPYCVVKAETGGVLDVVEARKASFNEITRIADALPEVFLRLNKSEDPSSPPQRIIHLGIYHYEAPLDGSSSG